MIVEPEAKSAVMVELAESAKFAGCEIIIDRKNCE